MVIIYFCINSNYIDFEILQLMLINLKKKIKCEYYNTDIHKSSFYLPNEYTDELSANKRLGISI